MGKESACNAGYTGYVGLIPGSGRFPGEGMATHSSILAWKSHGQKSLLDYNPKDHKQLATTKNKHCFYHFNEVFQSPTWKTSRLVDQTTTTSHWKPWLWYFTFPAWKTRGCSGLIPQISEALIKPQQVKLWLNTFPWGQTSLRRIECSSIFQNSIFSPPLAIRMKGFFSDIYCEKLVELQEVKFTKVVGSPWATGSP